MFAGLQSLKAAKRRWRENKTIKKKNKTACRTFPSQGYGDQESDLAEQSSSSLNKSECKDGF